MEVVTEQSLKGHVRRSAPRGREVGRRGHGALNKTFSGLRLVGQSLVASDNVDHTYVLSGFRWLPRRIEIFLENCAVK